MAKRLNAGVVELVDAPDSKSGSARSVGSTPTTRTSVYLRFEGRTFQSFLARHSGSTLRTRSTVASTPEAAVEVRGSSLRRPPMRTLARLTTSIRYATART